MKFDFARRASLRGSALPPLALGITILLVGLKFILHIATNWNYGYFRDELYYMECGRHLAPGYADMAPFTPLMAKIGLLLGGSITAIRLPADVAGALMVLLTILIARELGGGKFAQGLAGLCVLLAPGLLVMDDFLTTNCWEPVFWMGCIWMLARIVRTGDSRQWIWFGVFGGLGIENKHSALFFLIAVLAGVLLTPLRREFKTKWLWYGVGIIFLLCLPNLIWQIQHNFATYELLRNVQKTHKNIVLGPGAYFAQQVLTMGPLSFVVWGVGLVCCFLRPRWRVLGWTYVALFVIMVALKGKNYYFFPIAPMVMAAGAVVWEKWSAARSWGRWARPAYIVLLVAASLIFAPLFLPILPPARFIAYEHALHFEPPKSEVESAGPLPQYFGDQFGWEGLVAEVARDYDSLPPEERAKTSIRTGNYGEAGAVNEFGGRYGLPKAITGHQNYFFWGPPKPPIGVVGTNLIVLQDDQESLERFCDSVSVISVHHDEWGMAEENGPIYYCKGLKYSIQELWPRMKHWN
ncbi:MAG: glycosyltransferase family 39 protein [Acidobacteriaceae bacterium]